MRYGTIQNDTSYPYQGKLKSVHSAKKKNKKKTIDNSYNIYSRFCNHVYIQHVATLCCLNASRKLD